MSDDQSQNDQAALSLPVDQEMANRVMGLYQNVDQVLDELRVPEEERKEVEQNLMEAIAADLLVRLGQQLSEDDKKELADMGQGMDQKEPDLNAVAGFFRTKFSQEELVKALAEATESVLVEFSDAMRR